MDYEFIDNNKFMCMPRVEALSLYRNPRKMALESPCFLGRTVCY